MPTSAVPALGLCSHSANEVPKSVNKDLSPIDWLGLFGFCYEAHASLRHPITLCMHENTLHYPFISSAKLVGFGMPSVVLAGLLLRKAFLKVSLCDLCRILLSSTPIGRKLEALGNQCRIDTSRLAVSEENLSAEIGLGQNVCQIRSNRLRCHRDCVEFG